MKRREAGGEVCLLIKCSFSLNLFMESKGKLKPVSPDIREVFHESETKSLVVDDHCKG